jgi:UrcA family protein
MDKTISTRRNIHLVILTAGALVGAAIASESAIAQNIEVITVTAPSAVHKVVGHSTTGVPIEEISLSYAVGIADLDLTKPSGVSELEGRIDTIAKEACTALDKLNPLNPSDPSCVTKAIASAAEQKKQAIAAAIAR